MRPSKQIQLLRELARLVFPLQHVSISGVTPGSSAHARIEWRGPSDGAEALEEVRANLINAGHRVVRKTSLGVLSALVVTAPLTWKPA